jgi:hypothetical protein
VANVALLKASPEPLRALEQGLVGYAHKDKGPCRFLLADGTSVVVSVVGTDVGFRFECFSLAVEFGAAPNGPAVQLPVEKGSVTVSILLCEDYVEPFTGDRSQLVGTGPTYVQYSVKPGQVPDRAVNSCLVAYGLLVEGPHTRLAVVADPFPYNIDVITDQTRIATCLAESEVMTIDLYYARYGFS